MRPTHLLRCCWILMLAGLAARLWGAEAGDDDKLRAMLRDTMVQLRNAQAELSGLQSSQAAADADKKALAEKYELLRKQAAADHESAEKTAAQLKARLEEQKEALARLQQAFDREKAECEKLAQQLKVASEQATKSGADNVELQRQRTDLEARNLALFLLGNEILNRYEDFSLGRALAAKEPFVGKSRARLENLVQDYQDKLADQRAKP